MKTDNYIAEISKISKMTNINVYLVKDEINRIEKTIKNPLREELLVLYDAILEQLYQLPEEMKIKLYGVSYGCWEDLDLLKQQVNEYKKTANV